MEMSNEVQENLRKFQELQAQARLVVAQKYQIELEVKGAKKALESLEKTKNAEVHKAIGNIMIKADPKKTADELKETIETLELRLKTLEKQESELTEKLKSVQDRLQGILPTTEKGG